MNMWRMLSTDANLKLMSETLGISEIAARVMANRGIRSKKTALAYLHPALSGLHDASLMKDAIVAFDHVQKSLTCGDRIMVYGDYDVDGVMSTVILHELLADCGADVRFYIPCREEEGYGLNKGALWQLKAVETDLVIACDNGISALAEATEARALGIGLIIIDHHEPGFVEGSGKIRESVLPDAIAVIDPKQAACPYPFKELCAAGLAYKLAVAFCRYTGKTDILRKRHDEWLALAAIATICDIVDLQGENRVIVKSGLAILNASKLINPGLGSLIARKGYLDKPIDVLTAGFVIGPCINATGRLENAATSVQLLLASSDEEKTRYGLSERLSVLNDERKSITAKSAERVLAAIAKQETLEKVLVIVDEQTHESVAGIVAGRIKDSANRPVILLTRCRMAEEGDFLKGSGRSVEGYNMFEALYANRALLTRFGGHALAAGMTLPAENVHLLRERLNEICYLNEEDFCATMYVDAEIPLTAVTMALAEELAGMAPFGKGNREPLFVTRGMRPESIRLIGDKNTILVTFVEGAKKVKGIAFGLNNKFNEDLRRLLRRDECQRLLSGTLWNAGLVMDLLYAIEINVYNGVASVQMRMKDFVVRKDACI